MTFLPLFLNSKEPKYAQTANGKKERARSLFSPLLHINGYAENTIHLLLHAHFTPHTTPPFAPGGWAQRATKVHAGQSRFAAADLKKALLRGLGPTVCVRRAMLKSLRSRGSKTVLGGRRWAAFRANLASTAFLDGRREAAAFHFMLKVLGPALSRQATILAFRASCREYLKILLTDTATQRGSALPSSSRTRALRRTFPPPPSRRPSAETGQAPPQGR